MQAITDRSTGLITTTKQALCRAISSPHVAKVKRKEVAGQYKEAENKGRCCRTLERGSDEKHSLVHLHFVLNQYIFLV